MPIESDDLISARKNNFKCEVNLAKIGIYGDEIHLRITHDERLWNSVFLLEDECMEVIKKIQEFWDNKKKSP